MISQFLASYNLRLYCKTSR